MNNDPWGSFQNFMNGFQMLASNPAEYVMKNFGIPKEMANDPNAILQNLMNEGKLSQQQYNMARAAASKIQNNPFFRNFMGRM